MGQGWKSFEVHEIKHDCFEEIVGRNREDTSGKASYGSKEHVFGHERKTVFVIKNLTIF